MNDFEIDENGNLVIENGDLKLTESTVQHQQDIVLAEKAWIKHAPALGAALQTYINDTGSASGLLRSIRQELERDGQVVNSIDFSNDEINIDSYYPS